ncbi:AAA family ATPase [Stenotrophomonas koreensis]|uniref:AAA family ATPase n=1 Tax=Stenotrophomonas koreensis TaxID=266128 RepID=UPI003392DE32
MDDRPRFRLGLVVGKFSPLHQGHEYLIEHARRQCRQVLLLSWSVPELAGCDARRRQRWLRQRFPGLLCVVLDERRLERLCQQRGQAPRRLPVNSASDQEQQAFTAWLCADLLGLALDAVFSSEAYGAPYGREHWEQRGGRLDMADLQQIARVQQQREDTLAADGGRWLVCDTTALTTLGYAGWLFAASTPGLRRRAAQRRYAHLLLCAPDFVFVQDGTRQDAGFRARQHAWYVQELTRRRLPWTLLEGPLAQRLARACSVLGA